MAEENIETKEINNLSDLSQLSEVQESAVIVKEPKIDALGRSYQLEEEKNLQRVYGLKEDLEKYRLMVKI
jgi:hypothetical protein